MCLYCDVCHTSIGCIRHCIHRKGINQCSSVDTTYLSVWYDNLQIFFFSTLFLKCTKIISFNIFLNSWYKMLVTLGKWKWNYIVNRESEMEVLHCIDAKYLLIISMALFLESPIGKVQNKSIITTKSWRSM